jgi:hypothetical protein
MYSPKISETLIPQIYRIAKAEKIAMTKWVNRVLEEALSKVSTRGTDLQQDEESVPEAMVKRREERRRNDSSGSLEK